MDNIVAFSQSSFSVSENGTQVGPVTITRSSPANNPGTVSLILASRTATAGRDYLTSSFAVSFASGETVKTVTIPVVDDTIYEANEYINLSLANPTGGAALVGQPTASLRILDNDNLTPGNTFRASINNRAEQATDSSFLPAINSDGRYVAYWSLASNLVTGDTNGTSDVFFYDRAARATTRVSVSSNGTQATGDLGSSTPVAISSDGNFIAYSSGATNLVTGDTNGVRDIFLYERVTKKTSRVSLASNGIQGNNNSSSPVLSSDGRFIVYASSASNLVASDTNTKWDLFLYDNVNKRTTRVNVSSSGTQANGDVDYYDNASISGDGRFVAYASSATNLVSGDNNGKWDIFLYDVANKTTSRVSVSSAGLQGNGDSGFYYDSPSLSANGRFVAYTSSASNLVSGDNNGVSDIFVYDTANKTTRRVSVNSSGQQANGESSLPSISRDGRYIAFTSSATNLVSGDTNGVSDVFVFDTVTQRTTRVSVSSSGAQATGGISGEGSTSAAISGDGRYIGYNSWSTNLVGGDTNNSSDIFLSFGNYIPQDVIAFSASSFLVNESGTAITAITLNRTGGSTGSIGVQVNLTNGTAVAPGDYNNSAITVSFASGETTKTVTVPIVNDGLIEANETVNLSLSSATNATIGTQKTAVLTIFDNDTANGINQTGTPLNDFLSGGAGNDTLSGLDGNDVIVGVAGNDRLSGDAGNDFLNGGVGNDTLQGGVGNDSYVIDSFGDLISETTGLATEIDKVETTVSYGLGNNLENLTLTGSGAINGTGNTLANIINGNTADNSLSGGGGNDILIGNAGNDSLLGGAGNDFLTGGAGNDSFIFNAPSDRIDSISDFNVVDDTLVVAASGFGGGLIGGGPINPNQFVIGNFATSASSRFIYRNTTGALLFDVDGTGFNAPQQIATLPVNLSLTNQDIVVI